MADEEKSSQVMTTRGVKQEPNVMESPVVSQEIIVIVSTKIFMNIREISTKKIPAKTPFF